MPNAQHPEVKAGEEVADYAGDAYRACLAGRADSRQQQSCASAIILLNASKAELLEACRLLVYAGPYEGRPSEAEIKRMARAAISRATGASS